MKSAAFFASLFALARYARPQGTAGISTRYWDCCKPSCAWAGKADFSNPVTTCDIHDQPLSAAEGGQASSGCDSGGESFMCSTQQPFTCSNNAQLAYGFAAVSGSLNESSTCCACYKLTFTSAPLNGYSMVVQATNIGYDVSSTQFDIAIPGGGEGEFTQGCSSEWGAPAGGWGAQYGGVSSESQCSSLPSVLQPGCDFRFDWMQSANNPNIEYERVACPASLLAKSNCQRDDDSQYPAAPDCNPSSGGSPSNGSSGTSSTTATAGSKSSSATTPTGSKSSSSGTTASAGASPTLYGQCGGSGYTGSTQCPSGSTCQAQNSYYSQCLPPTYTNSTATTLSTAVAAAATGYGQCGGSGYTGSTQCPSGYTCQEQSQYYSQCLPPSSS